MFPMIKIPHRVKSSVARRRLLRVSLRLTAALLAVFATLAGLIFILFEYNLRLKLAQVTGASLFDNVVYFQSLAVSLVLGGLCLYIGMRALVYAARRPKPLLKLIATSDRALDVQLNQHLKQGDVLYGAKLLRLALHRLPEDDIIRYNLAVFLALSGELSAAHTIFKDLSETSAAEQASVYALEELSQYRNYRVLKTALRGRGLLYLKGCYAVAFIGAIVLGSIYGDAVQHSLRRLKTYEFDYTYLRHFKVFYQQKSDAAETIAAVEGVFFEICKELDVPANFLAGKMIKLFVCHDKNEYLRLIPHSRDWQGGSASWPDLEIYIYPQQAIDSWLLPHEIAHIVYGHYYGDDTLWLHEGIAQCEEAKFIFRGRETAGYFQLQEHFAPLKREYIPFKDFIELRRIPAGSSEGFIRLYYLQSFSVIYFLRQKFGEKKFRAFLSGLRHNATIEQALLVSHAADFRGLAELETLWKIFYTWE